MAALVLICGCGIFDPQADKNDQQTLRYVRRSGEKFVAESTVELQKRDRQTVLKSVTTRPPAPPRSRHQIGSPGTTLTLTAEFSEQAQLVEAEVTVETNASRSSARVVVKDQIAEITRADGSRSELECPRGVIVTAAPDWTDAVSMVQRYDRVRKGKQDFPGLWVHPTQEPLRLRFAITHLARDAVERQGQTTHLDRFLIELRGGSRYIGWGDERGRLLRLHPEGQPKGGIWLEGWEHSHGGAWLDPAGEQKHN
jgi:hypothetical protein